MKPAVSERFITFEGVDGSGKSTQLKRVAEALLAAGHDVVTTFEPGATALGRHIRALLLDGEYVPTPESELLLFLADRAQHVRESLLPALQSGAWVLCDRYSDSTLAYQLAARKLAQGEGDLELDLDAMLRFAECGLTPALTLWFDLPVEAALQRMQQRVASGEKSTRLDDEQSAFHARVAAAFARQHQLDPERIVRIDALESIESVGRQVASELQQRFGLGL